MFFVRAIITVALLVGVAANAHAQDPSFFKSGEDLTYRVSYMNVTLGTIRTVAEPATTLDGVKCLKVKVYINSHPNIPFVSLHSIYESWMDTSATFSRKFTANTQVEDKWEFDQYLFDYTARTITMEKYKEKTKVSSKVVDLKKRYNEGSSLLFAARSLLFSKKSLRLPTVIMEDTVNTVVNFQGTRGEVSIDASSYPVKTVYFNGDANWTGIYGLTGRFEGWFSDDEARIPIKAKMKVYVGSVTIELQSWRRGSWQPPKAG